MLIEVRPQSPGQGRLAGTLGKLYEKLWSHGPSNSDLHHTWRYRQKAEMACKAFKKYAEMPNAARGTPREVCGEPGRPDPIRRSVASIITGDLYTTSELTLP